MGKKKAIITDIVKLLVIPAILFTTGMTMDVADTAIQDMNVYITIVEQQNLVQTELLTDMYRYNVRPEHYRLMEIHAAKQDLDFDFMVRLMLVESGDDRYAMSNKFAYGLMQIQMPTAADMDGTLVSHWQLYNPKINIRIGTEYFRWLLDRYDGDYRLASLGYNMGPARLDQILKSGKEPNDGYFRKIEVVQ